MGGDCQVLQQFKKLENLSDSGGEKKQRMEKEKASYYEHQFGTIQHFSNQLLTHHRR
jgi:hypothetical protein